MSALVCNRNQSTTPETLAHFLCLPHKKPLLVKPHGLEMFQKMPSSIGNCFFLLSKIIYLKSDVCTPLMESKFIFGLQNQSKKLCSKTNYNQQDRDK